MDRLSRDKRTCREPRRHTYGPAVFAREAKRRVALCAAAGALYRVPSVGVERGQSARAPGCPSPEMEASVAPVLLSASYASPLIYR